jgi:hypothetical protein
MSELRDFVADLMERKGAVVEAIEPGGLEVLAPEAVQEATGCPELARLAFAGERRPARSRSASKANRRGRVAARRIRSCAAFYETGATLLLPCLLA